MSFQKVKVNRPNRNLFDLSHERKMSFNMGDLVPCYVQDIIPGDKFRVSSEVFLRFAPLLAPVMHRVNVFIHFFFVPNRLVWTNWENFITGGPDGTLTPTLPRQTITDGIRTYYTKGTLSDYLGIPSVTMGVSEVQQMTFSELPFRAYQLIYNEYYRDQNLTTALAVPIGDATSYTITSVLRKRCWEKDYFTSCLPWSQRGGDVNLPVEGEIEFTPNYKDQSLVLTSLGGSAADGDIKSTSGALEDSASAAARIENLDDEVYPLENVDITINELRQSVRLQEWLERNARGGARYIEQIFAHFGVKSSDARLKRPEYLGGGKAPVVISEVLATSDSGSYDPGSLLGHGVSVGRSNSFSKFFEEHGYIIGIISVLPRTAYQQGLARHWMKFDKLDYYFPEFALLGEQEVKQIELYHDPTNAVDDDATFGYQSRYAEYKFKQSSAHGDFRDTTNFWHMGRIFSAAPLLNTSFVEANPTHRIFQVTTESIHKMYCQVYNDVKAIRPMPKFAEPIL